MTTLVGKGRRPASHGPRDPLVDDAALFQEAFRAGILKAAWEKVWDNHGARGGDGVTCSMFARNAFAQLADLRADLADGSYHPGPLRRVAIPKRSGGTRTLSIPTVRDRIVQTAITQILTPHFEAEFEPVSFAYRPGRSVNQAVRQIEWARREGFTHVLDADIETYFDRVDHMRMMERLGETLSGGPLTEMIHVWLTHAAPSGKGLAQGSPLSPLLANLYLDRLDELMWQHDLRIVRFADDFVILAKTRGSAEVALVHTKKHLGREGLELNTAKTRVLDFDTGFKFLGHLFVRSLTMKVSPKSPEEDGIDDALRLLGQKEDAEETENELELAGETRAERAGYSPGLRVLYVTGAHRRLRIRSDAFAVEEKQPALTQLTKAEAKAEEWDELIAISPRRIDRVELWPEVDFDRATADALIAHAIPAALVDGHGETEAWLSVSTAPRAGLHMAQAAAALDPARKLDLARELVFGRLRSERTVLRRLLAGCDTPPPEVTKAIAGLNKMLPRAPGSAHLNALGKGPLFAATDVNGLRGYEGAGAKLFWPALGSLLQGGEFMLKERLRPAEGDPSNICLNMLTSLLTRDVTVAVLRAGLHPGFAVLHEARDGGDACVFDLTEEFRAPLTESLFVYLVNRRIIRPEHFDSGGGPGRRMNSEGARALIKAYEGRVQTTVLYGFTGKRVTWRRLMLEQAMRLAGHHLGRAPYRAYDMDQDRRAVGRDAGDKA
jgi:CRISP-associated protein Cas1